jgi:uncharacterized protein (UPF0303 family)
MSIETDIEKIAVQEQVLVFKQFDHALAWQLGARLKDCAQQRGVAITIEIRVGQDTVFFFAMPGTAPANADWARRKRNCVELLHRSSYGVGRSLELEDSSLGAKMGLPLRDYASHGGSFPIKLVGLGCIGVVTVSGLPQRQDHGLVVQVLAELCGVDGSAIALESP